MKYKMFKKEKLENMMKRMLMHSKLIASPVFMLCLIMLCQLPVSAMTSPFESNLGCEHCATASRGGPTCEFCRTNDGELRIGCCEERNSEDFVGEIEENVKREREKGNREDEPEEETRHVGIKKCCAFDGPEYRVLAVNDSETLYSIIKDSSSIIIFCSNEEFTQVKPRMDKISTEDLCTNLIVINCDTFVGNLNEFSSEEGSKICVYENNEILILARFDLDDLISWFDLF